jgi:hypothetical protein
MTTITGCCLLLGVTLLLLFFPLDHSRQDNNHTLLAFVGRNIAVAVLSTRSLTKHGSPEETGHER